MKFTLNTIIISAIIMIGITSCQDPIEVELDFNEAQLVVDAWVDNRPQDQKIRLTMSQQYFESNFAQAVTGAEISISNGISTHIFNDAGDGNYIWNANGNILGEIGDILSLTISINGNIYASESQIFRVPVIDSIAQEFRENELGFPDGNYAQLYARDFTGVGDSYWAKTYKNGQFLNKPIEMLIIYDSTFGPGSGLDGITFIPPLREAINPIPDEVENEEDLPSPYAVGDELKVELFSINNRAFEFMQIAQEQMLNGQNAIFALPAANTKSNIFNVQTEEPVLGMFNVGAVSEKTIIIQ